VPKAKRTKKRKKRTGRRNTIVCVRVPQKLTKRLQRLAAENRTTLSSFCLGLIEYGLAQYEKAGSFPDLFRTIDEH
jgi:hypothetical protein